MSLGLLIAENDLAWSSGKDHGELCPQSGPWLGQGREEGMACRERRLMGRKLLAALNACSKELLGEDRALLCPCHGARARTGSGTAGGRRRTAMRRGPPVSESKELGSG